MPISSVASSRDPLEPTRVLDDHRRTGRYVAGGLVLSVTLLTLHHVLLRDASTIAGICIPMIIMACYVLWVLYSARRDRRKALRLASAMQLTEVISSEPGDPSRARPSETEAAVDQHDTGMTSTLERPLMTKVNGITGNYLISHEYT